MKKLTLVDIFLIIIFGICIIQSIVGLFFNLRADNELYGAIDIVMRTTIASIFGYFISGHFKSLVIVKPHIVKLPPNEDAEIILLEQDTITPTDIIVNEITSDITEAIQEVVDAK